MKSLNLFITLLFLSTTLFLSAQNYNMTNGSISSCSGTFYDSGGNGGNYGNNQLFTFTICPSTPGAFATVNFTFFDIENNWDFLTIYDGNNTGAPSLGTYTGTTGPGFVAATASNASGCLTFVFDSDGSVTDAGWAATIGCTQPCQDVIANATFSPAPDGDGVIRLCQGETLNMSGSGSYPQNNTGYTQSDATSTFEWSVNGTVLNGQNTSYSFPSAGAYIIQLEITDVQGCTNTNDIDQYVYVSTTPIFAGTAGAPDPICLGEQADFTGVVNPVTFEQQCNQPSFPPIALPDGSGVSYQTSVNLDCYAPGQQLTNINDLQYICVNMEHSYMGDLEIAIECPSGQTVILVDYPNGGGGTYLGVPVDNDAQPNNQGTGYQYCWDPGATNGTWGANSGGTLPAGSYESDNPLSGLVGCDMNGDWTLIITDNLASDNGFIFDWSINFDPGILPPAITFTPSIVSDGWQADPTIVGGTNPITVEPTASGAACYTYVVTDDFGCTYDTTVCITVNPSPVINPIADITDCNPITLPNITGTDLTGNQAYYTGSNGTGTQYNPGDVIATSMTLYVYDEDPNPPFCSNEDTLQIIITNPILTMTCPGPLTAVCDISEQPAYGNFTDFQNAGGSASTTAGANILPGTFTLVSEVSDNNSCPETVTRTYQIEDDCGNIETCTQTITIDDNINPTGTAPANLTVQCIGDVPAANPALITDEADNCSVPTVTHVGDASNGLTCPEIITRTYRITDACGNFIDVTQTITVDDTTPPVFAAAPADITVECIGDVPAMTNLNWTDNCDGAGSVAGTDGALTGGSCGGTITRTWTYTDVCGNTATATQTITVDDTTPPVFAAAPADITVECI
ncbi:MAG: proprotein convertase P-domain-containing protein, partial [Brumimicrobium sp.]|nr:proprotein convertase P-domain-containing protein [Brumimicrobium sp.]